MINECVRRQSRLDVFVQSSDKNFLVPVGGSVIISPDPKIVDSVESIYPGRASSSQVLDLCATLLHLGEDGFSRMLSERRSNLEYFKERLLSSNLTLIPTPHNDISMAIEVSDEKLGSTLFIRGVSGARLVTPGQDKVIDGIEIKSFGAHHSSYPKQYLTVASAIGQTRSEIDAFMNMMEKEMRKENRK
jgi:O-phospho-L-seryl-tRNASec:L-selenocysteinyl-tRNA synthase